MSFNAGHPKSFGRKKSSMIRPSFTNLPLQDSSFAHDSRRQSEASSPLLDSSQAPSISITQRHPASLPDELVEMIRAFRASVESVSALCTATESCEELHCTSNSIIRYVSNFLIKKHQEASSAERRKSLGWGKAEVEQAERSTKESDEEGAGGGGDGGGAAATRGLDSKKWDAPENVGPLVLSSLYCMCETLLVHCKCDRANIFLRDYQSSELISVVAVGASVVQQPIRSHVSQGVAGAAIRTKMAINVHNTEKVPAQLFSRDHDNKTGYYTRTILCFPLQVEGKDSECIGVLELLNRHHSETGYFTPEDEIAAHYYSRMMSILLVWSRDVDFSGEAALVESARLQRTLLGQRNLQAVLRSSPPQSRAGATQVTFTEAIAMQQAQKRNIALASRSPESGLIANLLCVNDGPRMIYRTWDASQMVKKRRGRGGLIDVSTSVLATELEELSSETQIEAAQQRDVRDVALFLDRIEDSWKKSREVCIEQELIITNLKKDLEEEKKRVRSLTHLCVRCGIVPPSSNDDEKSQRLQKTAATNIGLSVSGQEGGVGSDDMFFGADPDDEIDDTEFAQRLNDYEEAVLQGHSVISAQEATRVEQQRATAEKPMRDWNAKLRARSVVEELMKQTGALDPIHLRGLLEQSKKMLPSRPPQMELAKPGDEKQRRTGRRLPSRFLAMDNSEFKAAVVENATKKKRMVELHRMISVHVQQQEKEREALLQRQVAETQQFFVDVIEQDNSLDTVVKEILLGQVSVAVDPTTNDTDDGPPVK